MNPNAAVVLDIPEFAEAIHKEADAGPRGADHLGQGLLSDGRDERFRLAGRSIFGHDEKRARQAPLAGVEKLIDQIGLSPDAAHYHEFEKEVSEAMFFPDGADHLAAIDSHSGA